MRSVGIWVLAVAGVSGCAVGGGETTFVFEGAEGVRLELSSGEIDVESHAEDGTAYVDWEGGGIGQVARPQMRDNDGWMVIDAGGGIGGGEFDVRIPEGLPLVVTVDRGELEVHLEAPADIDACVAAGEVNIGVPAGAYDLQLDTAVGEVNISGIEDRDDAEHVIALCVATGEITVSGF